MTALAALLLLADPTSARAQLGVWNRWGAFRDASPRRCYAVAQPVTPNQGRGFASIGWWPGPRLRGQVYVRLSQDRARNARVTLSIGERRFDLLAGDGDAWAPDARTDQAIVAAIRSGRSMSVEGQGRRGPFADTYALAGAATAIDAAALGCIGR